MQTAEIEGVREGYADVGDVRLHYVEAGAGPLVVLLHGFPEFWFSWRRQMPLLVAAGLRVVAPDMRGYNLSSKPAGAAAYDTDHLASDIAGLIRERGARSALLAGHDWGGAVAWATAMNHPEVVDRLAILNMPHPRRMMQGMRSPRQLAKSWYALMFQLPALPERALAARDWSRLSRSAFRDARPGAFSDSDLTRYVEAWSQPGAASGMLNYYRAAVRRRPSRAAASIRTVSAPTLVIWGERDSFLGSGLAEPSRADVPNLDRVVRLPGASHWVQHDEPDTVAELLRAFFLDEAPHRAAV